VDDKPYISFVVVARNDNYGGNFLHRMQAFLNVLLTLCEEQSTNFELVIVEWNPPRNNPRLIEALKWGKRPKNCKVRIIEVPNKIHQRLPHSDRMPLVEYVGKNVGVRRAEGEFILSTNPDLLFSEELVKFLGSGNLSPKCFYRIVRYDVKSPIPLDMPAEEELRYCEQHVFRIHGYTSYDNKFTGKFNPYRLTRALATYLKWGLPLFPSAVPFTNAAGDFFMMHRSHWHSLHGFPEVIGVHQIDSLFLYVALFRGLEQIVLRSPLRIYHQDHGRLESSKPFSPEVKSAYHRLFKKRKPIIFNDETWGLGGENLPEIYI
jgi:hypothetical protein